MYTTSERRSKPRICCDYPAIIVGYDNQGKKYIDNATLENLSGSGLYMRAHRYIENDSQLTVTVHLYNAMLSCEETPHLITKGIVVRTEHKTNGTFGVAIIFNHYRFK